MTNIFVLSHKLQKKLTQNIWLIINNYKYIVDNIN